MGNEFKSYFKRVVKNFKDLPYHKKTGFNNRLTMVCNYLWALIKLVFGWISKSIFLSISGIFTVFIGFGKYFYFIGEQRSKNQQEELSYYKKMAWCIIASGILYYLYVTSLYASDYNKIYDKIFGITIATISVCEIFFSLRGLIRSKKTDNLLLSGLKFINLSTALSSVVLTELALLSFTLENVKVGIYYTTAFGALIGFVIMTLGIYMLYHANTIEKKAKRSFLKTTNRYVFTSPARLISVALSKSKKSQRRT